MVSSIQFKKINKLKLKDIDINELQTLYTQEFCNEEQLLQLELQFANELTA